MERDMYDQHVSKHGRPEVSSSIITEQKIETESSKNTFKSSGITFFMPRHHNRSFLKPVSIFHNVLITMRPSRWSLRSIDTQTSAGNRRLAHQEEITIQNNPSVSFLTYNHQEVSNIGKGCTCGIASAYPSWLLQVFLWLSSPLTWCCSASSGMAHHMVSQQLLCLPAQYQKLEEILRDLTLLEKSKPRIYSFIQRGGG